MAQTGIPTGDGVITDEEIEDSTSDSGSGGDSSESGDTSSEPAPEPSSDPMSGDDSVSSGPTRTTGAGGGGGGGGGGSQSSSSDSGADTSPADDTRQVREDAESDPLDDPTEPKSSGETIEAGGGPAGGRDEPSQPSAPSREPTRDRADTGPAETAGEGSETIEAGGGPTGGQDEPSQQTTAPDEQQTQSSETSDTTSADTDNDGVGEQGPGATPSEPDEEFRGQGVEKQGADAQFRLESGEIVTGRELEQQVLEENPDLRESDVRVTPEGEVQITTSGEARLKTQRQREVQKQEERVDKAIAAASSGGIIGEGMAGQTREERFSESESVTVGDRPTAAGEQTSPELADTQPVTSPGETGAESVSETERATVTRVGADQAGQVSEQQQPSDTVTIGMGTTPLGVTVPEGSIGRDDNLTEQVVRAAQRSGTPPSEADVDRQAELAGTSPSAIDGQFSREPRPVDVQIDRAVDDFVSFASRTGTPPGEADTRPVRAQAGEIDREPSNQPIVLSAVASDAVDVATRRGTPPGETGPPSRPSAEAIDREPTSEPVVVGDAIRRGLSGNQPTDARQQAAAAAPQQGVTPEDRAAAEQFASNVVSAASREGTPPGQGTSRDLNQVVGDVDRRQRDRARTPVDLANEIASVRFEDIQRQAQITARQSREELRERAPSSATGRFTPEAFRSFSGRTRPENTITINQAAFGSLASERGIRTSEQFGDIPIFIDGQRVEPELRRTAENIRQGIVDFSEDVGDVVGGVERPTGDGEGPIERGAEGLVRSVDILNPASIAVGAKEVAEFGVFGAREATAGRGEQLAVETGQKATAVGRKIGQELQERPIGFGAELVGQAAIGFAISPIRTARFDVPTGVSGTTRVRGVRLETPAAARVAGRATRGRTLVGQRGLRVSRGAPDVDLDRVNFRRFEGQGASKEMIGAFETDVLQKSARRRGGDVARRTEAVDRVARIGSRERGELQTTSTEGIVREVRAVPAERAEDVARAIEDVDATIFGSAATKAQIPEARQPRDIDVIVEDKSAAEARFSEALEGSNAEVGDVFDIKEVGEKPAPGEAAKLGIPAQKRLRTQEGVEVTQASEELVKKAGASGFVRGRGTPASEFVGRTEDIDVGPEPVREAKPPRVKDVADTSAIARELLGREKKATSGIRVFKQRRLEREIEAVKEFESEFDPELRAAPEHRTSRAFPDVFDETEDTVDVQRVDRQPAVAGGRDRPMAADGGVVAERGQLSLVDLAAPIARRTGRTDVDIETRRAAGAADEAVDDLRRTDRPSSPSPTRVRQPSSPVAVAVDADFAQTSSAASRPRDATEDLGMAASSPDGQADAESPPGTLLEADSPAASPADSIETTSPVASPFDGSPTGGPSPVNNISPGGGSPGGGSPGGGPSPGGSPGGGSPFGGGSPTGGSPGGGSPFGGSAPGGGSPFGGGPPGIPTTPPPAPSPLRAEGDRGRRRDEEAIEGRGVDLIQRLPDPLRGPDTSRSENGLLSVEDPRSQSRGVLEVTQPRSRRGVDFGAEVDAGVDALEIVDTTADRGRRSTSRRRSSSLMDPLDDSSRRRSAGRRDGIPDPMGGS